MKYISVAKEDIRKKHILRTTSNNKGVQFSSKKDWMRLCFDDGLVFLKNT